MKKYKKIDVSEKFEEIDNFCEECKKEDKSVSQNLILIGFKIWISFSLFLFSRKKFVKIFLKKEELISLKFMVMFRLK